MELYLKEKVFSISGKYNVYDANENPLYTVQGKVISLHHKHYIHTMDGKQVAYISQKPIALMPKFFIELADGKTYEMKSRLALAHEVSVIEELGWEIKGKFLQHDYTITKDDQVLAEVHQKWLSWGDTFEIMVNEGVDEVLVLAVMLCFDLMHEEAGAAAGATAAGAAGAASTSGSN